MRRYPFAMLTIMLFAVAGCAAPTAAPPAASSPAPQAPAAAVAVTGDGQTYPGPYFKGQADAPVTIEEYADFQ